MADNRFPLLPQSKFGTEPEHLRRICQVINGAMDGHTNNQWVITLVPSATEQEILADHANINSAVQLTPMSATAAAAVGVYATVAKGVITVHHDSDLAADRVFAVLLTG